MTREELERLVWRYTHRDFRVERKDGTRLILVREEPSGRAVLSPLAALSDEQLFAELPELVRDECKESFSAYLAGKKTQRSA